MCQKSFRNSAITVLVLVWNEKAMQEVSLPELPESLLDSILYLSIERLYRYKQVNATKSRLKSRKLANGDRSTADTINRQRH